MTAEGAAADVQGRSSRASARRTTLPGDGSTVLFGGAGSTSIATTGTHCSTSSSGGSSQVLDVRSAMPAPPGTGELRGVGSESTSIRRRCARWRVRRGRPKSSSLQNDWSHPGPISSAAAFARALAPMLVTVSYNWRARPEPHELHPCVRPGAARPNYAPSFVDRRSGEDVVRRDAAADRRVHSATRGGAARSRTRFARSRSRGRATDIFWGFDDHYPTVADLPRRRAPGNQRSRSSRMESSGSRGSSCFSTIVNLGTGFTENATDATPASGPDQKRSTSSRRRRSRSSASGTCSARRTWTCGCEKRSAWRRRRT